MRILLVNPSEGPDGEYGALSKAATELPQLGIASIAASLHANNHHVKVLDFFLENSNLDNLLERIESEQYEMVGFSVYITTEIKSFDYAKAIKERFPNIKICVGGPQVTLAPDNFDKEYIDYVFLGESDLNILDLIASIQNGVEYPEDIKGILCNYNGKTLQGVRETYLVDDINALPMFDLEQYYDLSNYYPPIHVQGNKVINIISVRGCPYPCTFCAVAAINGTSLRRVSNTRFVDNIELYIKKGYDSFMIYDDTFTLDKKRAVEFCKEVIKRKLKIKWNCWSRVDRLDDNVLSYMKEAGCYLITFGCESFNEKTLQLLKKGYPVEQNLKGLALTKKHGILTSSSFMIGLPGETKEDILHTIDVVCKVALDFAVFPIFEPYKGTPVYDECKVQGHWIKSDKYKNRLLVEQDEVWEPYSIKRDEIEKLSRLAFQKFYLRAAYLFKLKGIMSPLPSERKKRMISAAFDYFVLSKFTKSTFMNNKARAQVGNRYK
jgi:anaerobic magnesium-protoporphyrin IX monomethyl ester cyclase